MAEAKTKAPAPTATAVEKAIEPERKIQQLEPVRMQDAEFKRLEKVCVAQPNTLPDDLLRQDYWAHVAPTLMPWTRIEARADDATWMADLVVLEAGRNWANVRMLHVYYFTDVDMAKTNAAIQAEYAGLPYEVKYRGEHSKWSVLRKSDQAVMHEEEGTKAGADFWMRERVKADKTTG